MRRPLNRHAPVETVWRIHDARNRLILHDVPAFPTAPPTHRYSNSFSSIAICNKCEQRRTAFLDKLIS
jgi:hypothetical protein